MAQERSARGVRIAADEAEREALWVGRKNAFGAVARIAPDYYLHDTVVPRTKLVEVLSAVRAIAAAEDLLVVNVFHAGDGNLHPLLLFDAREPGVMERVDRAGQPDRGGIARSRWGAVRRARHRPGEAGLHVEDVRRRTTWRPRDGCDALSTRDGRANPTKVLPAGVTCAEAGRGPHAGPAAGAGTARVCGYEGLRI